jgi:hypothetical protein
MLLFRAVCVISKEEWQKRKTLTTDNGISRRETALYESPLYEWGMIQQLQDYRTISERTMLKQIQ